MITHIPKTWLVTDRTVSFVLIGHLALIIFLTRVDVRWMWGRFGVDLGWMWGGCKVDVGWIWGGRGVDVGWIWGGYGGSLTVCA